MYEVVGKDILYFPRFIADNEQFLSSLNKVGSWEDWRPYGLEDEDFTYGTLKSFSTDAYKMSTSEDKSDLLKVVNTIKKINLVCGTEYLKHLQASEVEISRLKKLTLTDKIILAVKKYRDGGNTLGPHPDSGEDTADREFSVTFYPNDDYDGGELVFPESGIKIKPIRGSVVVYPSRYLHESLPATGGEKMVSNYVYLALEPLWN